VTMPADATPCTRNTLRVSPDGSHIAWIKGGSTAGAGTLMVAQLSGTHAVTLDPNASCGGATAIRWLTNIGAIEALSPAGDIEAHYVSSGRAVGGARGDSTDVAWSVDGNAYAALNGPNDDMLFSISTPPPHQYQTAYRPPAAIANWDGYEPRS